MTSNPPSAIWCHPKFQARRTVDLLCREFEDHWRSAQPVRIETFLDQVPTGTREVVLPELVASEWELREMAGDRPVRSDYCHRFPQLDSLWSELEAGVCESLTHAEPDTGVRTLKVGEEFCGYKILDVLGQGAMGTVFLAEMPVIGHRVALKILSTSLLQTAAGTGRFEREARLLSRLDHPGIVPLYSYGESNGIRYLVMKAITGWSLSKVIAGTALQDQSKFLSSSAETSVVGRIQNLSADGRFELLMDLARQLTLALKAVHDADVLHRDIKPSNIMLSDNGQVFLTDFSLACVDSKSTDLTLTNEFLGTLRYCAPESLDGVYSRQSDIYSLGLVLLELFTRTTPFSADSRRELLQQKLSGRIPELAKTSAAIPRQLLSAFHGMTHYDPAGRFESADAVLTALMNCKDEACTRTKRRIVSTTIVLLASLTLALLTSLMARGSAAWRSADRNSQTLRTNVTKQVTSNEPTTAESSAVASDARLIADFTNGWLMPERGWDLPGPYFADHISLAENGTSLALSVSGSILLHGSTRSASLQPLRSDAIHAVLALSQSDNGQFIMVASQDNGRPDFREEADEVERESAVSYFVETYSVPSKQWRRVGGPLFRGTRDLPYFLSGVTDDRSAVVMILDSPAPAVWSPQTSGFWKMTWPQIPWVAAAMKFDKTVHASVIQSDGRILNGPFLWAPDSSADVSTTMETESGLLNCTSLHFSPRTNHLIAMSDTGMCIVETESGKIVAKDTGKLFSAAQLQFSATGEQLAFFDEHEVRLFDLKAGEWLGKPLLSDDGILLASPLTTKGALLLVESSGAIRQLPVHSDGNASHANTGELLQKTVVLTAAAFCESAGRLVVGTKDGRMVSLRVP